jgi:hypothetical protein
LRQAEALQAINGTVELAVFKPEMLIPALLMQHATVFPRDFPQSDETEAGTSRCKSATPEILEMSIEARGAGVAQHFSSV